MSWMTRRLLSSLLAGAVAASPVMVHAAPPVEVAPLERKAGEKWTDVVARLAAEAKRERDEGQHARADALRAQVAEALVHVWREERELAALSGIVKTLHRRLGRSTQAVRVALRLMYELHGAELGEDEREELERLRAEFDLALRRLRREARPGDESVCNGPVGLRPGELVLEGMLPGDPMLVLRDVPGGRLEAIECPAVGASEVAVVEAPAPGMVPCEPVEAAGPSHWWLTGSGIGLLAVGGALVGLGVAEDGRAAGLNDDLRLEDVTVEDADRVKQQIRAEGSAMGLYVGGGVMMGVGAGLVIAGLVLAGDEDEEPTARLDAGLGGAVLTVRFE